MMHICSNCKRAQLDMETVTMQQHSAELCPTCAHIMRQNEARFLDFVRKQTPVEANEEMKKQHKLLSNLIAVGLVGIIGIFSVGFIGQTEAATEPEPYLSFIELKQLDDN